MRDLNVRRLSPVRIPQAYPVVQAVSPDLSLDDWMTYAQALVAPQEAPPTDRRHSGILVVDNEQGYIVGLCAYRTDLDLLHGRTLHTDHLVALDLFNSRPVLATLAQAIEDLAREFDCTAVQTHLPERRHRNGQTFMRRANNAGEAEGLLAELGHRVERLCLCKSLTPAAK